MVIGSNILAGASGQGGVHIIEQSIRFNDDDSAFLKDAAYSASPTSATDCTLSFWVKRCNLGSTQCLFFGGDGSGSTWEIIRFESDDQFRVAQASSAYDIITTQVFRDVSAWSNFVIAFNGDDSTAADRIKIYHNGSRISDFSLQTNPSSGYVTNFNSGGGSEERLIGLQGPSSGGSNAGDFYLSEINFVDGQALDPTSFGETSSDTGQWVPINTSGLNFGTNGYRITGANSSDLGADQAGSNDFTSSGLSSADSVSDSPTNNQATLNPLFSGATLSDGNLVASASGNSYQRAFSTIAIDDGGKYACEFQKSSGTFGLVGIMQNGNHTNTTGNSNMFGINLGNGEVFKGNPTASVLTTLTAPGNSLMRIEYDSSADTIKIFDDGAEIFPASTGVSNTLGLTGHDSLHFGCAPYGSGTVITAAFSPLSGTPTTDFKELTAANLPSPTIDNPVDYFNTVLYTANNADGHAITGVGFQPDWVWIKDRDTVSSHAVFDAVRGVSGGNKFMCPTNTDAEGQGGATNTLVSLDSDGFTLDDDSDDQRVNFAGAHVSWNWKANGAGSSNTAGSINTTSTSANTTAGFSISTFTGNGTSGATFGHGLGVAPKMVIVKERSPGGNNWMVGHDSVGWTKYLALDAAQAAITSSARWNDTAPSSTVVTLGDDGGINANTATYVAYCFAEVEGFSKISSFEGNSNADGTFVYTGFKPAFILTKNMDTADQWGIRDAARNPFNVTDKLLNPNAATAETTSSTGYIDILSNGFKARSSDSNINSNTIIYYAVAESPFKTATAR